MGKNVRHAAIALLMVAITIQALVAQGAGPKLAFDVATIKRNVSLERSGSLGLDPGGRFRAVNAPVFWLISSAYGEFQRPLFESQIVGAPDWLQSEAYDIIAKAGADVASLNPEEQFRKIPLLLRSLLEERFALKVHRETRQLPIYALVKLKRDEALGPRMTRSSLERVLVDRTGLEGRFDIELEWSPDQAATDKPSILAAVQEQLGLKLESDRGSVIGHQSPVCSHD